MNIGTARPTESELAEVPHHFIGNLSVEDYYSVGQFEKEALKKIDDIYLQNEVAVMVGGSMMYEKAVIEGLNELPEADGNNQKKLDEILETEGITALQKILLDLDPEYYGTVDHNNPRRLLRAIDIIWQTGKSYTENIASQVSERNFNVTRIGILAPR